MATENGGDRVYCRECGAEIRRAAEICPECGVRQRAPPSSVPVSSLLDGRNPLIAALLSVLFPGLGHVYARDIDTGLFFAVSFLLAVLSLLVAIGVVLVPASGSTPSTTLQRRTSAVTRKLTRSPVSP